MIIIFMCLKLFMLESIHCNPIVIIPGRGSIVGRTHKFHGYSVNQYLGIPYAVPPLGILRFKKPVSLTKFPEVLDAANQPLACPQYTTNPFPGTTSSAEDQDEDCLHLNIWTPSDAKSSNPAKSSNLKAVMYWIHGGGFRYGSIRDDNYNGIPLAALGDIIVVTVDYRVGPLGFLTSNTEDAPGNVGLWDIIEGLKWVNENIEYFGGDKSRITIAGESSGSIAVGLLSISPISRGLFARQIMMSGSPAYLGAENTTLNIAISQKTAEIVQCANETITIENHPEKVIKCLRERSAQELSHADSYIMPHSVKDYAPQYGGELFPMNGRQAIVNDDFICGDLLIGNNHDEGSLPLTSSHPDIFGFFGHKDAQINKTTGTNLILENLKSFPDPEAVANYYLPDDLSGHDYDNIRNRTYTAIGDLSILCPTVYYAEKCAQQRKVFFYYWTHVPITSCFAKWMGAYHFSEVPFVFGLPLRYPSEYIKEEKVLSKQLIEIWSSFVRNGKPSIPWPLYSRHAKVSKVLGQKFVTGANEDGPHKEACDTFRPFFGF